MKDRLIEILNECQHAYDKEVVEAIKENRKPTEENAFYADYLLAAGVIVPPCKVGDTVYVSNISCMPCHKITEAVRGKVVRYVFNSQGIFCIDVSLENGFNWRYSYYEFGKTIFLTREEAEKEIERSEE